jgi:hypothetical protein
LLKVRGFSLIIQRFSLTLHPENNKRLRVMDIKKIYEKIQKEHPKLVERLLDRCISEDSCTIYGELADWLRDYYTLVPLADRDAVARLLIGDYVIRHPYCLQRVYMVIQESNVDGEILFNAVPCTSKETAKGLSEPGADATLCSF